MALFMLCAPAQAVVFDASSLPPCFGDIELEGFHGAGPFEFFNPAKPFTVELQPVPLPATGILLLAGLAGLAAVRRRALTA